MDRVLFARGGSVTEVPLPGSDLPLRLVLEGDNPRFRVNHLERPLRIDRLAELGLQRHQAKRYQVRRVSEERLLVRQVPELPLVRVWVVIVDRRPRQPNQFVLRQHTLHGPLGPFAPRVIEWRDPELQDQLPRLAWLEVVVDSMALAVVVRVL